MCLSFDTAPIQAVTSIIIQIQIIRANLLSVPENKA